MKKKIYTITYILLCYAQERIFIVEIPKIQNLIKLTQSIDFEDELIDVVPSLWLSLLVNLNKVKK